MNQIVKKFLLAGDKFMPEMHLRQPGFTYSACGPFTRNKQRIQKLCKQEIQIIFTRTNWIKLVFNMIWLMANTKTLKKTQSDKLLKDKAFEIVNNP